MNGNDLLTLFMQNTDIFTDTFIIDELLDFFLAAMVTTQSVTQTMICHFIKDKESVDKLRREFSEKVIGDQKDKFLDEKGLVDTEKLLDATVNFENC